MGNHFERSLVAGHAGEQRLMGLVPGLSQTDGYAYDLLAADGTRIELKTESRSSTETANIAVEVASSDGRLGAIHAACVHADVIVWLFRDEAFFAYNPNALYGYILAKGYSAFRAVKVDNAGYQSTVLLVPRAEIAHLAVQFG